MVFATSATRIGGARPWVFSDTGFPASLAAVDCPDEDDIVEFVNGRMKAGDSGSIEVHIDGCSSCGLVVAGMVRILADESELSAPALMTLESTASDGEQAEADASQTSLPAGGQVGRYRVLECIGVGGMGVVYSAYDPELDRRVALKVLRAGPPGRDDSRRNARLQREAQAMARLAHPNVITVHDVGRIEDRVFLAMAFVDGQTLGGWVRERERGWKAIRNVFLAAGEGLVAAHEAGLIHRDFKPDNVLVGRDGRVLVTDFGLARLRSDGLEVPEGTSSQEVTFDPHNNQTLTKTGMLVGTPAYMAPEQYERGEVTPATDQFSFCVAMFEALYGERPFEGRTVAELCTNVCTGRVRTISDTHVPTRIREAVLRGLSVAPSDRFASMRALLTVLRFRPSRSARRWAMVGVPTSLLVVSLVWDSDGSATHRGFCESEHTLDGVWDSSRRDTVVAALLATGVPQAKDTAARVATAVDAYAESWVAAHAALCGLPTADVLGTRALKGHCLMRRRARLAATVQAFATPDERVVSRALDAVERLPDPRECLDEGLVTASLVPAPAAEIEERVAHLREELARSMGLAAAGRYTEARDIARQTHDAALELGYAPLLVEARYHEAHVVTKLGDLEEARRLLEEVAWASVEARHRLIAARAWIDLIFLEATGFGDTKAARRAARAAKAELAALGPGHRLQRRYLTNTGSLAVVEARVDDAMALFEQALELENTRPLDRAGIIFNIAAVMSKTGRYEEALVRYKEYLEIYLQSQGPSTPDVAMAYFNIAATYSRMDQPEDALEYMRKSLAIEEETFEFGHPSRADSLAAVGTLLIELGRADEAMPYLERALANYERPQLVGTIQAANHRTTLAEACLETGDIDRAGRALAAAREQLDALEHQDLDSEQRWYTVRASLDLELKLYSAARVHAERRLTFSRRVKPFVVSYVAYALMHLADIDLRSGVDLDRAEAYLNQASELGLLDTTLPGALLFYGAKLSFARGNVKQAKEQVVQSLAKLQRPGATRYRARLERWARANGLWAEPAQ